MKTYKEFIDEKEKVDGNNLEIIITSYSEDGQPVSTVMKHRYKNNGKWKYDADLDSGEQGGCKEIPVKVAEILKQFGCDI